MMGALVLVSLPYLAVGNAEDRMAESKAYKI